MTNVVELTLIALVGLAANFHSGLEHLKNKNYDKAIADLTQVISAECSVKDMKELALLYRAEAHVGKGNKAEALKDAAAILKITENSALKNKAVAIYAGQGGILKDIRPKDGPKACMDKFFAAVRNSDYKTARQLISGPLLAMLESFDKVFAAEEGRSFLAEMGRNQGDFSCIQENFNDTNQTATLSVSVDRGHMTFTLGLVQQHGNWTFATLENADSNRARRRAGGGSGDPNMSNLAQIGKALMMYSMDNGEAFPAQLDDLKQYTGGAVLHFWVDPATGKKERYLYHSGLKTSAGAGMMVAASPLAAGGGRIVLFIDGSVQFVTEDNFKSKAIEQKWALPFLVKKEEVAGETAAEVGALINKLGDRDSKVRTAARKRLREIGAPAMPFLKEQENNADPEIQGSVRELLK